jgi:hypothetical protein
MGYVEPDWQAIPGNEPQPRRHPVIQGITWAVVALAVSRLAGRWVLRRHGIDGLRIWRRYTRWSLCGGISLLAVGLILAAVFNDDDAAGYIAGSIPVLGAVILFLPVLPAAYFAVREIAQLISRQRHSQQ